jgi:hypothetical protein
MVRLILTAVCAVLIFLPLTGCTYVEQPTPPGQVAPLPPPPARVEPVKPYRNPNVQPTAPPPEPVASAQATGTGQAQAGPLMSPAAQKEFDRVYRKKDSPRLAIFLNRSLSDEVREWRTTDRAVLSVKGECTRQEGDRTETYKGPGGASAYGQTHISDRARTSPGEAWMWRFEEGFLGPFLDIGAKIIDRATIMRLTAAASGRQGSAYDPIAVKKIEMDSLTGKADLFIEILIRRAPNSTLGYEFKASAKEVNTGLIRANVTTLDWNYGIETREKVVATSTGYKFVEDEDASRLPEINIVSRDLALALMRSLAANWQR